MDILLLEEAMKTIYSALAAEFGIVWIRGKEKHKIKYIETDSKTKRNRDIKVSSNNYTLPKICLDFFNWIYDLMIKIAKNSGIYHAMF